MLTCECTCVYSCVKRLSVAVYCTASSVYSLVYLAFVDISNQVVVKSLTVTRSTSSWQLAWLHFALSI